MCGIAGALRPCVTPSADPLIEVVSRMTVALAHRGPDGQGVTPCQPLAGPLSSEVVFGHRRLAIIDLTDRARQPMSTEDGSLTLTFNGEIFNYRELRASLANAGHTFRSESDTEVILRGYAEWGDGVFERLDGMFALAIWDRRREQLRLVRDPLGIKPLYLYAGPRTVLFASEVRALLASDEVPKCLDPVALDQFLAYQTVPAPRTLVAGVEMTPPGAIVTIDARGRRTTRAYWDLLSVADPAGSTPDRRSAADVQAGVHSRLLDAVRAHMVSDVPVGVFLSGGIDSSALVSLLRTAGFTPQTFTVSFPGHGVDETPYARAIARAFDTDHQEITLSPAEVLEQVMAAARSADHPTGDGINAFVVARAVRSAGVSVALSGLGGDEFFGGYPSFRRFEAFAQYARAWRFSPRPVRRAVSTAVRSFAPRTAAASKTAALLESDGTLPQAFPIMRQLFSADQRRALLSPDVVRDAARVDDPYVALLTDALERTPGLSLMSSLSYAESRTYMHDVLLRDTDQMSMRHALEVRVPLLDRHLVEYLMGVPDHLRQPGSTPKRLLRESLGQPLPSACIDRPKRGFVLPLDDWMRTLLMPYCTRHLGADGLGGHQAFQPGAVEHVWEDFLAADGRVSWTRPWALGALHAWLEDTGVTG
jgi:asparagine synthase (glutamine-hydrolysing)